MATTEIKRTSLRSTLRSFQKRIVLTNVETSPSHKFINIFPNLYLGDICAAANGPELQKMKITHVLNCSSLGVHAEFFSTGWPVWGIQDDHIPNLDVSPSEPEKSITTNFPYSSESSLITLCPLQPPTYLTIDIPDTEDVSITPFFPIANEFIHTALSSGSILVHSQDGISRSVAFILAYLISRGMLLDDAFSIVNEACGGLCKPNPGFSRELIDLHYRVHGKSMIVGLRGCEEFENSFLSYNSLNSFNGGVALPAKTINQTENSYVQEKLSKWSFKSMKERFHIGENVKKMTKLNSRLTTYS